MSTSHRLWVLAAAISILATFASAGVGMSERRIEVTVPPEAGEGTVVEQGFYGKGLCIDQLTPEPSGKAFVVRFDPRCSLSSDFGEPTSVKVLAYVPGFKIATLEMAWQDVEAPTRWAPRFEPLPRASVSGRATGPDGKPLAGRMLRIRYTLGEGMGFFGYIDGMVMVLELGSVETDPEGRFHIELPWLPGDDFFQPGSHSLAVESGTRRVYLPLDQLYSKELDLRFTD